MARKWQDVKADAERITQLGKVMIHRKPSRVLSRACWSCGKSDTYCDGLQDQESRFCCDGCRNTREHDAHTGLTYDEDD